jgi:alpha-1,6-mannosyltransferase
MPQHSSKIITIVSRIDPIDVPDKELRQKHSGKPILIGVGSLIKVKRVDRFIEWLAAATSIGLEYEAVWLGDGPLRPLLEEHARNCAVSISWRGHVDSNTVAVELANADAMLLSSEYEVLSLAALEAMAKSLPIITSDFFGVSDFIIDQVTGIVLPDNFPARTAAELIAVLLRDDSLRMEMGNNARAFFLECFSDTNRMAQEYAQHYREVVKEI